MKNEQKFFRKIDLSSLDERSLFNSTPAELKASVAADIPTELELTEDVLDEEKIRAKILENFPDHFKQLEKKVIEETSKFVESDFLKKQKTMQNNMDKKVLADMSTIANIINSLREQQADFSKMVDKAVYELSLSVIEKMMVLNDDQGSILVSLASAAVKNYKIGNPFSIRVAKSDFSMIEAYLARNTESKLDITAFLADEHLNSGSCLIEYENSHLDAGIATQLKNIKKILLG